MGHVGLDRDVAETAFHASQSDRLNEVLPLLSDVRPRIRQNTFRARILEEDSNLIRHAGIILLVFVVMLCSFFVFAILFPRRSGGIDTNDGIHLAIGPNCGSLGGKFSDINSGLLDIISYKTIVSFGDSYGTVIFNAVLLAVYADYMPIILVCELP